MQGTKSSASQSSSESCADAGRQAAQRGPLALRLPGAEHIVRLFRWEKRLIARFALTALGRSAASLGVILLIKEFLAGAIGSGEGVAAALSSSVGATGALWLTATGLLSCYIAGALCAYDNQVTQQRTIHRRERQAECIEPYRHVADRGGCVDRQSACFHCR